MSIVSWLSDQTKHVLSTQVDSWPSISIGLISLQAAVLLGMGVWILLAQAPTRPKTLAPKINTVARCEDRPDSSRANVHVDTSSLFDPLNHPYKPTLKTNCSLHLQKSSLDHVLEAYGESNEQLTNKSKRKVEQSSGSPPQTPD